MSKRRVETTGVVSREDGILPANVGMVAEGADERARMARLPGGDGGEEGVDREGEWRVAEAHA